MKIKAYAKINLALDILGQREDGYHNVKMVMQQINLWDQIIIKEVSKEGMGDVFITLTTSKQGLPTDERNLAYKAALKMIGVKKSKGQFPSTCLEIHIEKNIPMEAGLAGGSTDAAAVLMGLNQRWRLGLSKEQLQEIGAALGADVPFCMMGGTALAEGIGDVLTKVQGLKGLYLVLSKPDVGVSTAAAYKEYAENAQEMNKQFHPDIDRLVLDLQEGDYDNIEKNMKNVFEYIIIPHTPQVKKTKEIIGGFAPLAVLMSGSGPSVYGVFKEKEVAKKAAQVLKEQNEETFFLQIP